MKNLISKKEMRFFFEILCGRRKVANLFDCKSNIAGSNPAVRFKVLRVKSTKETHCSEKLMSYSRWTHSFWYTYRVGLDYSIPANRNWDIQELVVSGIKTFTYGEIKLGVNNCLRKVFDVIDANQENYSKLPTSEDYIELKNIMKEFAMDVEDDKRLLPDSFDEEKQRILNKNW